MDKVELIVNVAGKMISIGMVAAPIVESIVRLLNSPAPTGDAVTVETVLAKIQEAQRTAGRIADVAQGELGAG